MSVFKQACHFCSALLVTIIWVPCLMAHNKQSPVKQENRLELPQISDDDILLNYTGFVVSYDSIRLIPKWVAYDLTDFEVAGDFPRSGNFGMDLNYQGAQAMREDYSYSGWDKGHMAPAADMKWSQVAMYESFYLTNVCPQNHELNAGDWLILENKVRYWANKYKIAYIVCGPVFFDNAFGTIGMNHVSVPDGFFKAIVVCYNNSYHTIGFLFDNIPDRHNLAFYTITINDLETLTGMDLFTNIPDEVEEIVEDNIDYYFWEL